MAAPQKLCCVVDEVVAHGDRVYSLVLRPEREVPRFRAGQFLHLALDPYDPTGFWPDSRVFSIASSPADRRAVRISYSVHGTFTTRMERDLVEGREVWVKMPYGDFVIDAGRDVVLFAGGTGITAFTAFLEGLTPLAGQPVTLAYGARTDRLLIYRDVVDQCAERVPALQTMYFVEHFVQHGAGDRHDAPARPFCSGRVSVGVVWPALERPAEASYYISGPPAMLRAIDEDLRARHVPAEAIHIDAWE